MNKFLIASVALFGLAGVAVAQEAPAVHGFESNVQNSNGSLTGSPANLTIVSGQANATVPGIDGGFNVNLSDNYSGK